MPTHIEGHLNAGDARFGIVVSRFNEFITGQLEKGATETLRRHGVDMDRVTIARCPGAFEAPLVAQKMADSGDYDAVIILSVVIRGATSHYDHVVGGVTSGASSVMLDTGVPVVFGVVTTETIEQAIERAGTKAGNRGSDAARTAIEMTDLLRKL